MTNLKFKKEKVFNSCPEGLPLCSREDDDINDVAFMAGVNLGEENARILTSAVGSVVQSCQDQLFLSPHALLSRILHKGTGPSLLLLELLNISGSSSPYDERRSGRFHRLVALQFSLESYY